MKHHTTIIGKMRTTPRKYKVEGPIRQWFVWRWDECWAIAAGPFMTKRRAKTVMDGMSSLDAAKANSRKLIGRDQI